MNKAVVFLGGTCNNSRWRERLIPMLNVSYFNPVTDDWDDDAYESEKSHREYDDLCLYVITPKMEESYSIAEVVDDSNKRPHKTILCILREDEGCTFDEVQWKSLSRVIAMCRENGVIIIEDLEGVAQHINILYE